MNEFVALLHTMTKDSKIDQVLGAFTDEDAFGDWAEEYLKKNPKVELYYSVLPLNPKPGESSVGKAVLINGLIPHQEETLLQAAKREYEEVLAMLS
jgi:hypothetical protein